MTLEVSNGICALFFVTLSFKTANILDTLEWKCFSWCHCVWLYSVVQLWKL